MLAGALLTMGSMAAGQLTPARPQPVGGLVLNEVLFDGAGVDGGTEAVEIFNTAPVGKALAGLVLADHQGATLYALPDQVLPAGGYVVVQLGPVVPELSDTDASDGKGHFFTGSAPIDRLPNGAGGVVLLGQTSIVDAVFWGTSGAPSGSQYSAAVAAGKWPAGGYVNISFASGAPLIEGESIGRSTASTDSNTVADWATDGGKNAMGVTLGLRNDMYVFTDDQLIFLAQGAVNEALGAISFANNFTLDVLSASHTNVVISDPDAIGGFSVTAAHDIEIQHGGIAKHLLGSMTATYERIGTANATSYSLSISGSLAAADGTSISLNQAQSYSGFHSLTRTENTSSVVNWTEFGSTYSFSATGTNTHTITGALTGTRTYARSGSDWGGAGTKTISGTVDYVKISDGTYQQTVAVTSSDPLFPPAFGTPQTLSGTRQVDASMTITVGTDKEQTRTFASFHVAFLDPNGAQTYEEILTKPGSYTLTRMRGTEFSSLGTWRADLDMELQYDWPTVSSSSPSYSKAVQSTTVNGVQNGEIVATSTVQMFVDSNLVGTMDFYVDGPRVPQGGCGCGCGETSGCDCGSDSGETGFAGQTGMERAYTGLGLVGCVGSIVYLAASSAITGPVGIGGAIGMGLYCGAIAWFGGGF